MNGERNYKLEVLENMNGERIYKSEVLNNMKEEHNYRFLFKVNKICKV